MTNRTQSETSLSDSGENVWMPVFTARQSHNSEVLRDILELYATRGARILDMTYGNGAFWRKIDASRYELTTNDLFKHNPSGNHWHFGAVPTPAVGFDVVVFDPPYVHGSKTIHKSLAKQYGIDKPISAKDITENYNQLARYVRKILRPDGLLIIKTQDEIESGKQVWRHLDVQKFFWNQGWELLDFLIVMQKNKPMMRHKHQKHARKNHSYFMVFRYAFAGSRTARKIRTKT